MMTPAAWMFSRAGRTRAARAGLLFAAAINPVVGRAEPIETEHLFGFTLGTDIGDVGDREIEGSATARLAKRTGSYQATDATLSAEFVPLANLRTEYTGALASYQIGGVSGFIDQRYTAFNGLSADFRYRFLDRGSAPFGFALGAEPHWGRADEITGEPGNQFGIDFVAAADIEIVPERIVAAFNLIYQPESMRAQSTGIWSHESEGGLAIGVMAQIHDGIFVGGEARYLRRYDGLALDTLSGQGLFVGPTVYVKLSQQAWMAVAWSEQVAGHTAISAGALDLINFEHRQIRLLFGVSF